MMLEAVSGTINELNESEPQPKEPFMNGWVTWTAFAMGMLAGIGAVATGAAGMLAHYVDPSSALAMSPDDAMKMIQGGFLSITAATAAVGLGRKLDKNIKAVKESKQE